MAFKSMHGQMIIPFTLEFFIFMRRTLKYQYIKKTVSELFKILLYQDLHLHVPMFYFLNNFLFPALILDDIEYQ